ncbi:phage DNA polymerase-like protein [Salinisphaera dokdonensis CL-ES53]|uniref:Type-4 uracil-DNA glycosylase n=1 Tax=Salinisphaera dokdonensis CL-ES53 TaxID=1304272 RepID=A0ABV2AWD8_9GAMM
MTPGERKHMLSALGLVDWRTRPDGVLARSALTEAPEVVATPTPVEPEHSSEVQKSESNAATQVDKPVEAAASESDASAEESLEISPEADAPVEATVVEGGGEFGPVSSMDWDALEAWLATRDHRGATRPVFGVGARDADVLIVGEAPGASEDEQGVPFVGRAGKLLDRMLFAIGCSRATNVYITNICKFRPPNNRDPNPDEVAADWPILERQIELMDPKLVVAVGRVAAQTLLDSKDTLGKLRGRLHRYPRRELDVLVTYHPAFLLRSPGQKAKAWDDLKQIAGRIAAP